MWIPWNVCQALWRVWNFLGFKAKMLDCHNLIDAGRRRDFWVGDKGLYFSQQGRQCKFYICFWRPCPWGQCRATQVDVSQLRKTKQREPKSFTIRCRQTCLIFALYRNIPFIILDSNLPSTLQGDTISLFRVCSLALYQHSWKDSPTKITSAFACKTFCRNATGPWRIVSQHFLSLDTF